MNPHLSALGFTLIHFCWQAAVIGGLYKLAELTLPRLRHPERYLLGLVAMVAMLVIAIATFVYEDVRLGREPVLVALASATDGGSLVPSVLSGDVLAAERLAIEPLLPWLDAAWLLGVCVLALRMAGGLWFIRRLQTAVQAVPDAVAARFQVLMERSGLANVDIRLHPMIDGPFVIGALKSVIYLPLSAVTALSPDQLDAVLAHELEHVRRADYVWNLVQSSIETLFFFHPVVWWLGARLREQRELCCDDAAVRLCRDPLTYATALLELEERRRVAKPDMGLAMALNGEGAGRKLVSRIARVLGESIGSEGNGPRRSSRTPAAYALPVVALVLCAFVAPGAQVAAHGKLSAFKSMGPQERFQLETTDVASDEQPAQELDDASAAVVSDRLANLAPLPDPSDDGQSLASLREGHDLEALKDTDRLTQVVEAAREAGRQSGDWISQSFAWKNIDTIWEAQAAAMDAQQEAWQEAANEVEASRTAWEEAADAWPSKAEQEAMRADALVAQKEAIKAEQEARKEAQKQAKAEAQQARLEALAEARAQLAEQRFDIRADIDAARREAEAAYEEAQEALHRDAENIAEAARQSARASRRDGNRQGIKAPVAPLAAIPAPPSSAAIARLSPPRPFAAPLPPTPPAALAEPAPAPAPAPIAAPAPAPHAIAYKIKTNLKPAKTVNIKPTKISITKPVKVKIDTNTKVSIDLSTVVTSTTVVN